MACSRTIQDSVTYVSTVLRQQVLQVSNWQPGLNAAQIVLNRVLGPPMRWRFNRGSYSFAITPGGGTDYVESIADLGWIEKQWITDSDGKIHQLEGAVALAKTTNNYRPKTVAPQYDDNAGNITFRFDAIPSSNDTVFIDYQKKAPLKYGFGELWAPMPDEYSYIYDQLFLALCGNLVGDNRVPFWSQQGIAALIGAQEGLKAQEIAIFLGEWDRVLKTMASSQDMTKAGGVALTK